MEQSGESFAGQTKADVVTDCRSMYDILTRTAVPSCSEHQTTIVSSDQGRVERQLDVRLVSSQGMLADCLTKRQPTPLY